MKVLVACEESQRVCIEFRKLGHQAFSCDILDCSGGHPEWYIKDDVLNHLNDGWDLMIAHPPCTYLSYAGIRWFNIEKYGDKAIERHKLKDEAIEFFMKLWNSRIPKICIENPKGFIMKVLKPTQTIQPWMFGDSFNKPTLLWLKNLDKLKPTNIVDKGEMITHISKRTGKPRKDSKWYYEAIHIKDNQERSKFRSKTFLGIAKAMAEQWS